MHHDTWKGIILKKQGLLVSQSAQKICGNLNGFLAQLTRCSYWISQL
ncbi:hypothetical protein HPB00_00920 [Streptococcus suis]|nr:hypothetical protein [Streptococcus suis]